MTTSKKHPKEEISTDNTHALTPPFVVDSEGFSDAQDPTDDFEEMDLGNFEIFKFSIDGEPQVGATFIGKFKGIRDGELEENKGINGLNFEDMKGNAWVISSYYQIEKFFSQVSAQDAETFIYRIALEDVLIGKGKAGKDVFVFNIARKRITA